MTAPYLAAYLADDTHGDAMRGLFHGAPLPSLLLPEAIDAATAAALRAELAAAATTAFDLADRGRYRVSTTLIIPGLWAELTAAAARIAATPLGVLGARWLRFGRGDYALIKDDYATRPAAPHLELTLDLSTAASGEAEIVYSDGAVELIVPQLPHLLALVARPTPVARYERPPTVRGGGIEVVRLRLWLGPAA